MKHKGFAFINVISPCVTFNNNVGSTKSYDYVREHIEATSTIDFVPEMPTITTNYSEGTLQKVTMHDGSAISLHKLANDWDPLDRISAMNAVQSSRIRGEILTGLLYVNPDCKELHEILQTNDKSLNSLAELELCPGSEILKAINADMR